ncbi:MAG: PspC domain-containing protein [Breznakibacter sp.]
MKKTLNINLDGFPFQIEEDAYELLRDYLHRIESKLGSNDEAREVVSDIESRIAELFRMEGRNAPLIITHDRVAEVIQTIGEPDEFIDHKGDAAEGKSPGLGSEPNNPMGSVIEKRLYRNPNDKVLGGVCSGLAAYFNMDVLIVRVLFVLGFLLSAGTLVTLAYLVLWIAIPKAVLIEQKLAMQGGISFSDPGSRNKGAAQSGNGVSGSSGNYNKGSYFSIAMRNIGRGILSVMGFFVFLFGLLGLLAFGVAVVSGYSIINAEMYGFQFNDLALLLTPDGIGWWVWIASVVVVALPLVFLMYLGFRMMLNFKAYMGVVIAVMVFLWMAALGVLVYNGLDVAMSFRKSCERTENIVMQSLTGQVLHIHRIEKSLQPGRIIDEVSGEGYVLMVDSVSGKPRIFGAPEIKVEYGDSLACRVVTKAHGRDLADAMKFRQQIHYRIRQADSVVYCDQLFGLGNDGLFRMQQVEVVFTVPKGTRVVVDPDMSHLVEF